MQRSCTTNMDDKEFSACIARGNNRLMELDECRCNNILSEANRINHHVNAL